MFSKIKEIWNDAKNTVREVMLEDKPKTNVLTMEELKLLNFEHYLTKPGGKFNEKKYSKRKGRRRLLLVDDEETMFFIYDNCFTKLEILTKQNIQEDFEITPLLSKQAAVNALAHIFEPNKKYDFALLDLSLDYIFKVTDLVTNDVEMIGKTLVIDGVDLAIELHKQNPDIKIRFVTSHSNDFAVTMIKTYADKFNDYFNANIADYYISKLDNDKHREICKFLYEDRQC